MIKIFDPTPMVNLWSTTTSVMKNDVSVRPISPKESKIGLKIIFLFYSAETYNTPAYRSCGPVASNWPPFFMVGNEFNGVN